MKRPPCNVLYNHETTCFSNTAYTVQYNTTIMYMVFNMVQYYTYLCSRRMNIKQTIFDKNLPKLFRGLLVSEGQQKVTLTIPFSLAHIKDALIPLQPITNYCAHHLETSFLFCVLRKILESFKEGFSKNSVDVRTDLNLKKKSICGLATR